jgi:GTPase involved in cell partitioning and DNA repair
MQQYMSIYGSETDTHRETLQEKQLVVVANSPDSLPETWLSPTAKNLQEITKNRQDNSSCQLTDRKTPSG